MHAHNTHTHSVQALEPNVNRQYLSHVIDNVFIGLCELRIAVLHQFAVHTVDAWHWLYCSMAHSIRTKSNQLTNAVVVGVVLFIFFIRVFSSKYNIYIYVDCTYSLPFMINGYFDDNFSMCACPLHQNSRCLALMAQIPSLASRQRQIAKICIAFMYLISCVVWSMLMVLI